VLYFGEIKMPKKEEKKFFVNKFGNVFGNSMLTPIGRADWVYLDKPNSHFKPEKYSLTILFDKKEKGVKDDLNKMISACAELVEQAYGDKKTGFKYGPIRNGDEEGEKGKAPHPGYYYIKANNAMKPTVKATKGGRNVDIDPAVVTAGVQVIAEVQPMLFDDGFAWRLNAVQFVKNDGIKFSHGPSAGDMFAVLSEDEDDTDKEDTTIEEAADEALVEAPKGKKNVKASNGKNAALDML
jgi:hypothetical protein